MAVQYLRAQTLTSLPVRGAWIEIIFEGVEFPANLSLPVRGAWIEIETQLNTAFRSASLPVRGAWIEIPLITVVGAKYNVAPRAGSVD